MQIELPLTAREAKPGQFIHMKVNDPRYLLRRPISIAGTDPEKGLVEIIYRIVGKGTEAMSHLKEGDVVDSLGPLGTSFSMDKDHMDELSWLCFSGCQRKFNLHLPDVLSNLLMKPNNSFFYITCHAFSVHPYESQ